jgi:heme exporter protein CcmB
MVTWKDVLSERRSKESLNALVFFSLLLLFVFQFALGPERARVEAALPGLLWLGFILSGLLAFGRTFLVERENDCWEGLVLTPGDKSAIYLGKLAGNVLVMIVVEVVLIVLFAVFFGLDFTPVLPGLAAVLALGTLGLASVGTLFGAITAQMRAELLFRSCARRGAVPGFRERDPDRARRRTPGRRGGVAQAAGRGGSRLPRGGRAHVRIRAGRLMAARALGWLAVLALIAGLGAAFGYAPREAVQGNVQRIMYLHVPAVLTAYLAFALVFLGSVGYLLTSRAG